MTRAKPFALLLALLAVTVQADTPDPATLTYQEARWHPLHFAPAASTATDAQCLACHAEVLEKSVRAESPAGVAADQVLAWYATLDTYEGEQETFHRRHLVTDYAKQVMDLKCNTCHVGIDPRDETARSHAGGDTTLTQRKHVDPEICLLCHGQFEYQTMGVPGPWLEFGHVFQNNCLLCHATIRTVRHNVNYLEPEGIENLAKEKQDVCFGCHGGRPWYRISYPYPRHPWPGMSEVVPDWAKGRPETSPARFLIGVATPAPEAAPAPSGNARPAQAAQPSANTQEK